VSHLTKLRELYVSRNQIREIEGLEGMTSLEVLDLYDNQIRDISQVKFPPNLRYIEVDEDLIPKEQCDQLYAKYEHPVY
jgi:Leucine-rich repeat (LRR) protein